jgi:hypothetical protein
MAKINIYPNEESQMTEEAPQKIARRMSEAEKKSPLNINKRFFSLTWMIHELRPVRAHGGNRGI